MTVAYFCNETGQRIVAPGVCKAVDPKNGQDPYTEPTPAEPTTAAPAPTSLARDLHERFDAHRNSGLVGGRDMRSPPFTGGPVPNMSTTAPTVPAVPPPAPAAPAASSPADKPAEPTTAAPAQNA